MKYFNNKLLFIFIMNLFLLSCYSQDLKSFSHNGKIGYIDQKLRVVIPPKYGKYSTDFIDGYAVVSTNSKILIIDSTDTVQYSTNAKNIYHIKGPFFAISEENLYKIVNIESGRTIINELNLTSFALSDDNIFSIHSYESGWGYVDTQGNRLFSNLDFRRAYPFDQNVASVVMNDWHSAILDIEGNIIYKGYRRLGKFFSEGLCPAQTMDLRTGYVNVKGQFVFELPLVVSNEMGFENTEFENGRAIINCLGDEKYWIIIDNEGNYQSDKIRADDCYGFNDGMAIIHIYSYSDNKHIYGYVNTQGTIVYDYQFSEAENFYNGYARIVLEGKEGLIDKLGNIYYSSDLMKDNN